MRRNEGGKTRQSVQKAKKKANRPDAGKGRPPVSGGKTRANAAPPPIQPRPGRTVDTGRRAGPRLAPSGEHTLPALHGQNPSVAPEAQTALRNAFGIYEHPLPADPQARRAALMLGQQYKMRTGRNLRQQRNMRDALAEAGLTDFGVFNPDAYLAQRAGAGAFGVERLMERPNVGNTSALDRMIQPAVPKVRGMGARQGYGLDARPDAPRERINIPARLKATTSRDWGSTFGDAAKGAAVGSFFTPAIAPATLGILGIGRGGDEVSQRVLPPLSDKLSSLRPQVDTAQAMNWAGNDQRRQELVNLAAAGEETEQGITLAERRFLEAEAKKRSSHVSDSDLRRAGVGQLLRWAYPADPSALGFAANLANDMATTVVGAPAGAAGLVRSGIQSAAQGSLSPLAQYASDTFVEPYVQLVDDPKRFAYENPFTTGLLTVGAARAGASLAGRARAPQARRPVVLDKLPGRQGDPVMIQRGGLEPRNLIDLGVARLADRMRQRSPLLQKRFAEKDAAALGARTRTASQNAAAAQTAQVRELRRKMTPLEQVRYDWADSKGLTPQDWIGFYEGELAKVTERLNHALTKPDDRRYQAYAVQMENRARDLNEQINGWRQVDAETQPTPPELRAALDAEHRLIDERNRPMLERAGLPPENIEARRFAETRMIRNGDLPADDVAAIDQLRAEGISPFYTRNAPATRAGDAFRGAKAPIPHADPATAAVAPGSMKRWTGTTIRQGRLNVDPDQTLRALERPAHAERYIAGMDELFDRYGEVARAGDKYDQTKKVLIDRNRLRQLQKEARQDDGGTWDKVLDDADTLEDGVWTTIGEKPGTGRIPTEPGDYILMDREIFNAARGQVLPNRLGRKATMLGQATDAWRLGFMHPRPGYHTANMATSTMQALVGGVRPGDILNAMRLKGQATPKSIGQGTQSNFYGPRVRDLPTKAGEFTGRGGMRRPFTNQRGELGGPLGTLLKPVRSLSELWRNAADSYEKTLHDAGYLKTATPEAARRAKEFGTSTIDELRKIAKEEDLRPYHAEKVKDIYGDFTKRRNEAVALGAPFYRWYTSMLRQTFYTMPLRHPNRTLVLNLLGDQGEEELDRLGLPLFPGTIGAVPVLTGGKGLPDWTRTLDLRMASPYAVATELLGGQDGELKNPLSIAGGVANPLITDAVEPWLGGSLRGEPRFFRDAEGQRYGVFGRGSEAYDWNLPATLRTIGQRLVRLPLGAFGQLATDRSGKADTSIDLISEQNRREYADPEFRDKRGRDLLERALGWAGIRIEDRELNDPAFRRRVMLEWKDAAKRGGYEVPEWVKDELNRMSARTDAERDVERAKEEAKRLQRSAAPIDGRTRAALAASDHLIAMDARGY